MIVLICFDGENPILADVNVWYIHLCVCVWYFMGLTYVMGTHISIFADVWLIDLMGSRRLIDRLVLIIMSSLDTDWHDLSLKIMTLPAITDVRISQRASGRCHLTKLWRWSVPNKCSLLLAAKLLSDFNFTFLFLSAATPTAIKHGWRFDDFPHINYQCQIFVPATRETSQINPDLVSRLNVSRENGLRFRGTRENLWSQGPISSMM